MVLAACGGSEAVMESDETEGGTGAMLDTETDGGDETSTTGDSTGSTTSGEDTTDSTTTGMDTDGSTGSTTGSTGDETDGSTGSTDDTGTDTGTTGGMGMACNPLNVECDDGDTCVWDWNNDDGTCEMQTNPGDVGDECNAQTDCLDGLMCVAAAYITHLDCMADGCCTQYCDNDEDCPNSTCEFQNNNMGYCGNG